jgi:hypothetical protein
VVDCRTIIITFTCRFTTWESEESTGTLVADIPNNIFFASTFSIAIAIIIDSALTIASTWFWIREVKKSWFGGITMVTDYVFVTRTFSINWIAIVAGRTIRITFTFLAGFAKMLGSALVAGWEFNKSVSTLFAFVSNDISVTKTFSIFIARIIFRSISIAHASFTSGECKMFSSALGTFVSNNIGVTITFSAVVVTIYSF